MSAGQSQSADRTAGTALGVALASLICMGLLVAPVALALAARARRRSAPGDRAWRIADLSTAIAALSFAGWSAAIVVRIAAVLVGPVHHTATGRLEQDRAWQAAVAALPSVPDDLVAPTPRALAALDGVAVHMPEADATLGLTETAATFWVSVDARGGVWRHVAADLDEDGRMAWAVLPPGARTPVPVSDPDVR